MPERTLNEIWHSFRHARDPEWIGDFVVQRIVTTGNAQLFAAVVGNSGAASLILVVPASDCPGSVRDVSTPCFTWESWQLPGVPDDSRSLVLELRQPGYFRVFESLAEHIREAVARPTTHRTAVQVVQMILDQWRFFFSLTPGGLDASRERDLIGKLEVLGRLVGRLGEAAALRASAGAFGPPGTFECSDRSIRVATFPAAPNPEVSFSNPVTPDPRPDVPVLLACQEILPTDNENLRLDHYVAHARGSFPHRRCCRALDELLKAYGYDQGWLYRTLHALGTFSVYHLPPDIVRIPASSWPRHAARLSWNIPISALAPYRVNPDVEIGPARPAFEIPF